MKAIRDPHSWPLQFVALFATLALAGASEQWILLLPWLILWATVAQGFQGKYPRIWVYAAIVPFSIWWVFSPTGAEVPRIWGLSAYALWIPAWFFAYLALVQLYALHGGGYARFVVWNSTAVVGLSGYFLNDWVVACVILWGISLVLALRSIGGLGTERLGRFALRWIAVLLVGLGLYLTGQWISHQMGPWRFSQSRWNPNYNRMKGFEPSSWLGTFADEYDSPFDEDVAMRVFGGPMPQYLRAVAYGHYRSGVWISAPEGPVLYPQKNRVEYSVFSLNGQELQEPEAWVMPATRIFGHLFAPLYASGVAVQEDSIKSTLSQTLMATNAAIEHGYWIYAPDTNQQWPSHESDLHISPVLQSWLDSVLPVLDFSSAQLKVQQWMQWLQNQNYQYSLQVSLEKGEDPLRSFVRSKAGYCEYFATLTVLALRQNHIPARYITGFAGPKSIGNAWVFQRRDAHAWVEWQDENGRWRVLDPTPPDLRPQVIRISWWSIKQEQMRQSAVRLRYWLRDGDWKVALDALQVYGVSLWNSPTVRLSLGLLAILGMFYGLYRRIKRLRNKSKPGAMVLYWQQELSQAEKVLKTQGHIREPWEGVQHFLQRLPTQADPVSVERLKKYVQHRFALQLSHKEYAPGQSQGNNHE